MLRANRGIAIIFLVIGAAILIRTLTLGGGQVGFLAAAVFLVLGVIRWRALRSPQ